MERYEVRQIADETVDKEDRHELHRKLRKAEPGVLVDVIWDVMHEGKSSYSELVVLREKIQELNNKSGQRVRCMEILPNRRVLVKLGPIVEELMVSPDVNMKDLSPGCEVLVIGGKDGRMVAGLRDPSLNEGRFSKVVRKIDNKRVMIESGGHNLIMRLVNGIKCEVGDEVRYDLEAQMVLEVLSQKDKSSFSFTEKPEFTFDDIKGLEEEKRFLRERIIYPAVYKEKFQKYGLKGIRGGLFHGPPGCGKSMLAGAIFNEMAKLQNSEIHKGFFVINGPEVLSKWAGNTEEAIRGIFEEARKAAKGLGLPSIIFWDEIESITSKRKDSATYSPEKTVVPTLLAELQGVKDGGNVILIGATNRPDLIDPALLRPGRLGDAILEIPRPEKEGALEILQSALSRGEVPTGLGVLLNDGLAQRLINHVYDNERPLAKARTQDGKIIGIMRQELVNGALFSQIGDELVRRACMAEIYGSDPATMTEAIKMLDNIFLSQLGVLDAGSKNGFMPNPKDIVIDVSMSG